MAYQWGIRLNHSVMADRCKELMPDVGSRTAQANRGDEV
jgi:hypothetical protein